MDLVDVLILVLRLALVAALYAFLLVVIRLAVRSLRAAPAQTPQTAWPRRLRLLVLEPGASDLARGGVIEVADGATLGRAARANVVVADPAVSAEHARLISAAGGWLVHDLGSTNGTLLNNRPLGDAQAPLGPGDVLGLGGVRLRVVST